MARVTRKQIRDKVEWLNNRYGLHLYAGWAAGHTGMTPLIYNNEGYLRELSPRLPTGQMLTWLEALQTGLEIGYKLRQQEGEELGLKF